MGSAPGRSVGIDLRLEHADVREIAVFFCVIEPIADDERVRHLKAGIGGVDRRLAAGGLIEQGGNGDGGRPADAEIVLEIVQRDAAVENVLNEDDVTALDVLIQVLVDLHGAGGRGLVAVGPQALLLYHLL